MPTSTPWRRIGEQRSEPLGHGRLADPERLDGPYRQRRQREPRLQPGTDLLGPHAPHLRRHAGHQHHDHAIAVVPPARRRPDRIRRAPRPRGRASPGGDCVAGIGPIGREALPRASPGAQGPRPAARRARRPGPRGTGRRGSVPRPPVASTTLERERASVNASRSTSRSSGSIRDRAQGQAETRHLATEEGGIGVDGLAEQQLGADREQFGVRHRRRVYGYTEFQSAIHHRCRIVASVRRPRSTHERSRPDRVDAVLTDDLRDWLTSELRYPVLASTRPTARRTSR